MLTMRFRITAGRRGSVAVIRRRFRQDHLNTGARACGAANLNAKGTLMHSIPDKAEVGIDFPDKFYVGGFGRDSRFEAKAEEDAVLIRLVRAGEEKRVVEVHLHHFLLANILNDLAASLTAREPIDEVHRQPLAEAAHRFAAALDRTAQSS